MKRLLDYLPESVLGTGDEEVNCTSPIHGENGLPDVKAAIDKAIENKEKHEDNEQDDDKQSRKRALFNLQVLAGLKHE